MQDSFSPVITQQMESASLSKDEIEAWSIKDVPWTDVNESRTRLRGALDFFQCHQPLGREPQLLTGADI